MDIAQTVTQQLLSELAANNLDLPTLPEVAIQVREMAEDPDISVAGFARVIAQDPALTTRVVGVANSPLMRGTQQIQSIEQAVARLGINFATNLATGFAMAQMFQATTEMVDIKLRKIWQETTEIASFSIVLARLYTRLQPDWAMLAGLTHNVGALPVLAWVENNEGYIEDPDTLDAVIEAVHPQIGTAILQEWSFPAEIVCVPTGHREFKREAGNADYVDLVTVAVLQHEANTSEPDNWESVSAFKRLGLDPAFERDNVAAQSSEISAVFH